MKTMSIRMLTALLLASATAAGLVTDAVAKVTTTQTVGPSQSMVIVAVVPGSTNYSKTFPGVLKVGISLAPASACQLVLRLDPPGGMPGSGAFIAQITPSDPSAAALIDATTLFTGSNLSVQNVTLAACSFTVDFD
jgi:hypothetical protein